MPLRIVGEQQERPARHRRHGAEAGAEYVREQVLRALISKLVSGVRRSGRLRQEVGHRARLAAVPGFVVLRAQLACLIGDVRKQLLHPDSYCNYAPNSPGELSATTVV